MCSTRPGARSGAADSPRRFAVVQARRSVRGPARNRASCRFRLDAAEVASTCRRAFGRVRLPANPARQGHAGPDMQSPYRSRIRNDSRRRDFSQRLPVSLGPIWRLPRRGARQRSFDLSVDDPKSFRRMSSGPRRRIPRGIAIQRTIEGLDRPSWQHRFAFRVCSRVARFPLVPRCHSGIPAFAFVPSVPGTGSVCRPRILPPTSAGSFQGPEM